MKGKHTVEELTIQKLGRKSHTHTNTHTNAMLSNDKSFTCYLFILFSNYSFKHHICITNNPHVSVFKEDPASQCRER